MLEQHAVEVRAPHLVGVWRAVAEGTAESEAVVAALVVRLEICAELHHTERAHLIEHTEPLEHRQIHRQQGFTDMKARVMRLFEHDHPVRTPREERRSRAAGGPATDHDHVTAFRTHRGASLRPRAAPR